MDRRSTFFPSSPVSSRMGDPPAHERSIVFRYGVAVVATMVALVFKLALGPIILPSFYVPFYGAVLVSAWVGGLGPGVVASVLSFGIGQVLYSAPLAPPRGSPELTIARDILFLFVAIGWSWGTAALHASQRRVAEVLQAARDELEARVALRTAELRETNRQLTDEIARRAEAEERFRNGFEHAPIGMALVGRDGRPLQINRALCTMLGYNLEELLSKPVSELMHPDDWPGAVADRDKLLAGEIPTYQAERRYLHKSGSIVWAQMGVSALRDASGQPLYLISHLQDITARKRAEAALRDAHNQLERRVAERTAELSHVNDQLRHEVAQRTQSEQALRESEARFREMADTAPVLIWVSGADGRCTFFNRGWLEFTGRTMEQEIGNGWAESLHPEDRQAVEDAYLDALRARRTFTLEYRLRRFDGEYRWILDAGAPRFTPGGGFAGYIGSGIDIAERKRVEEELERTNRRIRAILEEISDGFYTLDHDGRFTYLNPSAVRLFERPADQLLGKTFREAFPEAAGTPFHDQYDRLMTDRVRVDIEAYYAPRNRWFRVRGYPTQRGASVMFEDVTERHEEEVTVMNDILGALNAHLDVANAFTRVAAGLRQLTGCDRSSVAVFEEGNEWVRVVALDQQREYLQQGVRFRVADVPTAQDALEGRAHIVRDLAVERQFPAMRVLYAAGYRSRLSVPLPGRGRILGVLNLLWREVDGPQGAQLPVINQVAAATALALEKSRLFEEVRGGRERLQALSHRLLEVQEAERHHIARELHDEIGQLLTALKLTLDTLERVPAESAVARLHDAQLLVNDLVTRVRDLSLDLRPAMLDDLGLLPALLWLFGRYSAQTSVQIRFEHTGLDRRFSPDLETAAYRIVQEALTHVARHAGVSEATVRVWTSDHGLSVQVTDLGKGFDPESVLAARLTGGLSGLHERGLLLGG